MKYINFDPYYSKSEFNSFLMSAFNNSIELKVMCYDYIMNRTTQKVVKGISNKQLYCVYHLVLKRKLIPLHFSKMGAKQHAIPSITNSSNLNDDKWILSANRVIRRRAK